MKPTLLTGALGLLAAGVAYSQNLYDVGSEAQESMPLKWVVGASLIYDDNVNAGAFNEEDSLGLNPYVGLSFVSITPQTTVDVYARLGLIYYFDSPDSMDDVYSQSRLGVNITHRFTERLRLTSRNFVSYELEPDYSYGYAGARQTGEYFYWQTDNALGFRWTERLATYTGFRLTGYDYDDVDNNDRFIWTLYNQFRYQLTPQTVLTLDYRYSQTLADGAASDSTNQYLLGGVEHRFSPNTIGILRVGAQFRDVDNGENSTNPYVEFALRSQINEQFRVRSYARYGVEDYDTVLSFPGPVLVEYDERKTLRFGISGEYAVSREMSLYGGVDYLPTSYESGRVVGMPATSGPDVDEDIINAYIGISYRFTDYLTGNASYNYTNSSSDVDSRDYDRNRISVGLSAEF